MTQDFHKHWLKVTAIVVGSFGPVFFLATMAATAAPAAWTLDLVGWPLDGAQNFDAPTTRFMDALAGGFLIGWGALIWCLSDWVYDHAPDQTRRAVVVGLLAWFLLDSAGSIISGNPWNVGFNLLVLLLAVGPLWVPARDAPAVNA